MEQGKVSLDIAKKLIRLTGSRRKSDSFKTSIYYY